MVSHRIELASEVSGVPVPENFRLAEAPMPEPGAGQVLVRSIWLGLDPYIRGAIAGSHMGHGKRAPGDPVPGRVLGEVIESRHAGLVAGDLVEGEMIWATHCVADGASLRKVDPALGPLSAAVGVLGMPGLTGWASCFELARPEAGDTVLVSAALGPVGSTVGQLSRIRGCKVIGTAGSAEKCRLAVERLGYDACVNYKDPDFADQLKAAAPNGIDYYHDNVGGLVLQTAFSQLALYGTVVLCGLMTSYNTGEAQSLPVGMSVGKRANIKGLVVYDFYDRWARFHARVAPFIADGRFRLIEDRAEGLAAAPQQFCRLMRGENVGKALVSVGAEPA